MGNSVLTLSFLCLPCYTSEEAWSYLIYYIKIFYWLKYSIPATLPFKSQSYDKLKHLYLQNIGIDLPQDGTYPGSLLSLLQRGLALKRDNRMDLASLQTTLLSVQVIYYFCIVFLKYFL